MNRLASLVSVGLAALVLAPAPALAQSSLDEPVDGIVNVRPRHRLAAPPASPEPEHKADKKTSEPVPLTDFDLPPPPLPAATDHTAVRHGLLVTHEVLGVGLVAAMAGAMVTGQLQYDDRFGPTNDGRYDLAHKGFSYSALGLFASSALFSLLAPGADGRSPAHVTVHKVAFVGAALGFAAEAALGIYGASREGFVDQASFAGAHLVVGYTTLAFLLLGLGSLAF